MSACDPQAVLGGIRVVDLGRFIAGPYCATLLSDLGADVVRVERPGGGEDRWVVPVAPSGEGGSFLQLGRNKRSVCLDLGSPAGREVLEALIARADVVVANLPTAQLVRLGLDYESLSARYPRVILVTASAYGEPGPLADRTGFDGIGQAMSGAAWLSGQPDAPVRWAATYVDFGTALGCAFGTLAALRARDQSGRGQHVRGSLLRTALTFFNSNLMETQALGHDRVPSGNRGQQMAPSDLFATRDGHVLVQVLGNAQFHRLAALVGQPEWITDAGLRSDADRGRQAPRICEAVAQWAAARTCEEVLKALADHGIPGCKVLPPSEALSHPHMQAAGHFRPMDFPSLPQPVPVVAPLVELSETPASYRRRAPLAGEHTREVLAELGYGEEEIERIESASAARRGSPR
ncbi:CoA transferase [Ramlibacter sp. AW1]|uniref:CoA transferase n=1 Tax=Ramlibacter aurantiacus TaxID=2801330 RepID=A0A936ZSR0_9BURK|nr:CoA transferase [Ramlibacter aurantiacus]MBL0421871.1 CoA transferase [Ramlibacter aurantiacus]